MNYHNITKDDMLNGEGLRVVLWVAGCDHKCDGCQNPQTWNADGGIKFDEEAKKEIFDELEHDYVRGITITGGDPLNFRNIKDTVALCTEIKKAYPEKDVWLYTGYEFGNIPREVLDVIDVVCTGKFKKDLADENCPWVGSTNQRVIDLRELRKEFFIESGLTDYGIALISVDIHKSVSDDKELDKFDKTFEYKRKAYASKKVPT